MSSSAAVNNVAQPVVIRKRNLKSRWGSHEHRSISTIITSLRDLEITNQAIPQELQFWAQVSQRLHQHGIRKTGLQCRQYWLRIGRYGKSLPPPAQSHTTATTTKKSDESEHMRATCASCSHYRPNVYDLCERSCASTLCCEEVCSGEGDSGIELGEDECRPGEKARW